MIPSPQPWTNTHLTPLLDPVLTSSTPTLHSLIPSPHPFGPSPHHIYPSSHPWTNTLWPNSLSPALIRWPTPFDPSPHPLINIPWPLSRGDQLDKLSFFWDLLLYTSNCSIIINTCMYNDCSVYSYIGFFFFLFNSILDPTHTCSTPTSHPLTFSPHPHGPGLTPWPPPLTALNLALNP